MVDLGIQSALELIVPDNQERQQTVMKELTGSASIRVTLGREVLVREGQAYAEFVH